MSFKFRSHQLWIPRGNCHTAMWSLRDPFFFILRALSDEFMWCRVLRFFSSLFINQNIGLVSHRMKKPGGVGESHAWNWRQVCVST